MADVIEAMYLACHMREVLIVDAFTVQQADSVFKVPQGAIHVSKGGQGRVLQRESLQF